MTRLISLLLLKLALLSCEHPEKGKYERNKGIIQENLRASSRNLDVAVDESTSNADIKSGSVLKMELEDGVRYVWIKVNGIKLRFIFDTGASSICISPTEASVLYKQGTLREEDILDSQYFQDATGRISEGTKVNLREIKIGNMILENVEALIIDNVNAPLLLGQTVLERFGSITIDNVNNVIIFH